MTTRQTLMEIWRYVALFLVFHFSCYILPAKDCQMIRLSITFAARLLDSTDLNDPKFFSRNRDGRMKGLFMGVGPRVARAGPSVGIVVSFYEVVKYALYHRHQHNA